VNKQIKIVWDEFSEQWVVMEGGLPFRQIYQSMNWQYASHILMAYTAVGYKDVTDYDATKAIADQWK
jgi:hypothetical protein